MKLPSAGTIIAPVTEIELPGIDPYRFTDDGRFFLGVKYLEHVRKSGGAKKYYDAGSIPIALETPYAILAGLNRVNFTDAFCYVARPESRWMGELASGPPPPLMTFAVYVVAIDGKLVVLDWNWVSADPKEPNMPNNWRKKFGGKLWPMQ